MSRQGPLTSNRDVVEGQNGARDRSRLQKPLRAWKSAKLRRLVPRAAPRGRTRPSGRRKPGNGTSSVPPATFEEKEEVLSRRASPRLSGSYG